MNKLLYRFEMIDLNTIINPYETNATLHECYYDEKVEATLSK